MRPMILIERVLSVFVWVALVGLPVGFLGLLIPILGGLLWFQERDPALEAAVISPLCCGMAAWVAFAVPLVWLIKAVLGGKAGPWLREVAAQTGGRVFGPTLVWAFVNPRLEGEVEGFPFRLSLQRFGGILAPAVPGRGRGPFVWLLRLHLDAPARGRAGFARASTPNAGMGFFGLRDGVDRGPVRCWSGDPAGRALGEDPAVLAAAESAVRFDDHAFARVGPGGIDLTLRLTRGQRPEEMAGLIVALGSLGRAARPT